MAHQTTINSGNQTLGEQSRTMVRNVGDFTNDLTTLAELQAKLFAADLREMAGRLIAPITLAVLGGILLLAFLITLLEGLAFLFESEAGMSRAAGFGLSALCGLVLAIVLMVIAWFLFRGSMGVIKRSQDELANNLKWLRVVLQQRGRPIGAPADVPSGTSPPTG